MVVEDDTRPYMIAVKDVTMICEDEGMALI